MNPACSLAPFTVQAAREETAWADPAAWTPLNRGAALRCNRLNGVRRCVLTSRERECWQGDWRDRSRHPARRSISPHIGTPTEERLGPNATGRAHQRIEGEDGCPLSRRDHAVHIGLADGR